MDSSPTSNSYPSSSFHSTQSHPLNSMNPSSPLNSGRSSSSGSNFRSRPVRNNHNRQGINNNNIDNGIGGGRTRFGRLGPNLRSDQQEENQGLLSSSQDTDPDGEVDGDGATLNSFDERGGFTDRTFQRDTLDGDGNQDWNSPEGSMRRNSRDRIGKRNKGWGNTFRLGGKSSQGDKSRTVGFEDNDRFKSKFPPNLLRNQKYSLITFLPLVLYEQFKFFFNLYFLLVALSQFIPALKIGFIATYVAPLAFVLAVTIGKEAIDDYGRFKRDRESNSTGYKVLVDRDSKEAREEDLKLKRKLGRRFVDDESSRDSNARIVTIPSSRIKVGDLVWLEKNQRVPADMVLLRTSNKDFASTEEQKSRDLPTERQQFVIDEDDEEEAEELNSKGKSTLKTKSSNQESTATAEEEEEESGTCFVRTDQLDGETDWKLRVAVDLTQSLTPSELIELKSPGRASVYAGEPIKDIHTFVGNLTIHPTSDTPSPSPVSSTPIGDLLGGDSEPGRGGGVDGGYSSMDNGRSIAMSQQSSISPLTAENVLWANTVLAAGSAIGFVIYTGKETRAVMNTSHPETKVGLLDLEINRLSKILCGVTLALSIALVALNGFRGEWYIYIFRFLILFSSIIPISLRVNLDMGKTVYARQIMNDDEIKGTIVRTSTLPEELGRIEYLLSDKTGTLTQNEMELKKLHMGTMSYGWDSMDEVGVQLSNAIEIMGGVNLIDQNSNSESSMPISPSKSPSTNFVSTGAMLAGRGRRDMSSRVKDVVLALALCHNVTPVHEADGSVTYQASSPDEVAIVRWTESVGLALVHRDRTSMSLKFTSSAASSLGADKNAILTFDILEIFPFTSESKRMGIVIRDRSSGELTFIQKGADTVMSKIVLQNDWLDEECANMAREGLRTLVVGRKKLTEENWLMFEKEYKNARVRKNIEERNTESARVVTTFLESNLELLGLTGVEDKLQEDVKTTLELLRNAGIKVWMLTGDKIETATCIAISSKLVARNQYVHQVAKLKTLDQARDMLDFVRSKLDCCLVIDGDSLQLCLDHFKVEFIDITTQLSAVVACRCSPTQKADVARLIRFQTKKRVCCIGDGGNDVSMIQAADVGLGIVGKEGKQASLAADFSLIQFSHLTKLLVWHGRNSYKRSSKLAQFVIHRGLIISIIQAVFSSIFYFAPIALYQGWLMVGYATIYTMAPVFSLVLDRDVSEDLALLYPELYKDLTKGRMLSGKTFTEWLIISIYQGGAIMILSLLLFENEFLNIVSISFTALVVNELIMVALEITTWHVYMFVSEVLTLFFYCISIAFLPEFFDLSFVLSSRFFWKTAVIIAVSSLPLYIIKIVRERVAPPSYSKLAMS